VSSRGAKAYAGRATVAKSPGTMTAVTATLRMLDLRLA